MRRKPIVFLMPEADDKDPYTLAAEAADKDGVKGIDNASI
jgi:hypothetical protein